MASIKATYTSVFDDSLSVSTPCRYDKKTKRVFAIQTSNANVENTNAMTDEFVILPDGTELRKDDGVEFDY